jgi:uncharacterized membrane protein YphA (DoxX/SURF4 family)
MKDYILDKFPETKAYSQKNLIAEIVVILCILMFAYAAFSKLMDFGNFRQQLERSPYISNFAAMLVWLLPGTEILSAVMMIFPRTRKYGLYVFTLLMLAFTLYIAVMLLFSSNTPCICGGVISGLGWFYHMIFNLGFLALAISAIRTIYKNTGHPY